MINFKSDYEPIQTPSRYFLIVAILQPCDSDSKDFPITIQWGPLRMDGHTNGTVSMDGRTKGPLRISFAQI